MKAKRLIGPKSFSLPEITMKFSMAVLAVAVALVLFSSQLSAYEQQKSEYAFSAEIPEASQVIRDIQGKDAFDTAVRRRAALSVIGFLLDKNLSKRRLPLTVREQAIGKAYIDAIYRENQRYNGTPDSYRLYSQTIRLMTDRSFTQSLLKRYFSEPSLREMEPIITNIEVWAQRQVNQEPRNPVTPAPTSRTPAQFVDTLSGKWLVYTVVALLLLALGLAREIRPFGLDDSDPFTIRSGWSTYKVYSSTGTVLSPTKSREVTTHVSGGRDQPVSSSTTTSIHDQFFIREANGSERALQLTNVNIALREGHQLSAVWGIRTGMKSGPYFLFRNHSTRNVDFLDSGIGDMMRPHWWPVLPLLFISLVVVFGFLPVNTNLSGLLHNTPMPELRTAAALGAWYHMLNMTVGLLLATVVAVTVTFFIAFSVISGLRIRRLKHQIADKLLPILDQRAPSGA